MRLPARYLLALVATLGACATAGRQYGRDGLARVDHDVRADLLAGRYGSAYEAAMGTDAKLRDRLLRALTVGTLGLYASRTDSSVWALDRAWWLAEDRWSKRLASAAASVVVNDYVLPYTPGPTERQFIPFYGALSWLSRGAGDDAAVEARRLVQLLGEAAVDSGTGSTDELHGLLHYVAGAVFEASGDRAAADVAYRNAARLVSVPVSRDSTVPDSLAGDVVVVLEQGFVGHPVPRDQTIWVSHDELSVLRGRGRGDGEGPWRRTAGDVRVREGMYGYGSFYSRRGFDVGLSISWPEFLDGRDVARTITVDASGAMQPVSAGGNISRAVRADFERGQPARFTRALLRAAARAAVVKAAGDELSKAGADDTRRQPPRMAGPSHGPNAGAAVTRAERPDVSETGKRGTDIRDGKHERDVTVVGHVLAGIGLFALAAAADANDAPDLRSWNLLPHDLRVVRLRLRAGPQDVRAIIDGEEVMLGHAMVRAGQVTVLSQRVFQAPARTARVVSEISTPPGVSR